jgi:hypothetical protein
MADYQYMCSQYQLVGTHNNELVTLVTAQMLGIQLHMYGADAFTWHEANKIQEGALTFYVMNGCNHFWGWLHNSELSCDGMAHIDNDIRGLDLINPCLFGFSKPLSNTPLPKSKRARRKGCRTLEALAAVGKAAEDLQIKERAEKFRHHMHYVLQFVLSHVGSLLPDDFKSRRTDEQVVEAVRIGGDWIKGRAEKERGLGPFTEKVFKDIFCQEVLAYLTE